MSMSEAERTRLKQLGTAQAKVAKAEATRVAAENKARFEDDLKREFAWHEREEWKQPMAEAEAAIAPLAARVDAECERLGIPKAFRPTLSARWNQGGLQVAAAEAKASAPRARAYRRRVEGGLRGDRDPVAAVHRRGAFGRAIRSCPRPAREASRRAEPACPCGVREGARVRHRANPKPDVAAVLRA